MKRFLQILIFLLVPSLVQGTLTVKVPESVLQPPHTVDRVTLRSLTGRVYQDSTYFYLGKYNEGPFILEARLEPINYDSAGTFKRIDYTIRDTSDGIYTKWIKLKPKLAFEWNSSGDMRYLTRVAYANLISTFNQSNINTEFNFNSNGIKVNYTLYPGAVSTLTWSWSIVPDTSIWKGTITTAMRNTWLSGKFQYPKAWDANGDTIHVTRTLNSTTVTYALAAADTVGKVWPLTVDPSIINDTTSATLTQKYQHKAASAAWATARDSTWGVASSYVGSGNLYECYRGFYSFRLAGITHISVVDSARYYWKTGATTTGPHLKIVEGTFHGVPDSTWFKKFTGWTQAAPHAVTLYSATVNTVSSTNTVYSWLLNAAALDTIESKTGTNDTFRLVMLDTLDINNNTPDGRYYATENATAAYLKIFYTVSAAPTIAVKSDSVRFAVVLWGTVSATGGQNLYARGFKLWPKGGSLAGDTITVSQSGSFGAGDYQIYIDSLQSDTLYRWIPFGDNIVGRTLGAMDSFTTYMSTGSFYVDGRLVTGIH